MTKRLIMVLALAFVVGIAFTAYAEVQNVKVSGDLVISGVARNSFDLDKGVAAEKATFALSQVRVRVDADLTDNVIATVRLINEKLWGLEDSYSDSSEMNLDLAFVTLKEFLYSPLTLTVGRQELKLGNGLVVGARYNNTSSYPYTANTSVYMYDLTERKAFDAVKAVLDYNPLIVTAFASKINEDVVTLNDDINLYGVNAAYTINDKSGVQVYCVAKTDSNGAKTDTIYTPGILYTASPMDNLALSLEGAIQKGHSASIVGSKRSAYAMQAMANYLFKDKNMAPSLGVGYTYVSGDKNLTDKKVKTWDPMYEDQAPNNITNALFSQANAQVINIQGGIKPRDDVSIVAKYGNYRLAQKASSLSTNFGSYTLRSKKDLGNALDLTATYDYTEDVQLGLTWGMFKPGKAFLKADRVTATQLIGSMKVTF